MANDALPLREAIQVVVGEQLSSVTFVMDYWQLAFDGHGFSIFTWLSVTQNGQTVCSGEAGFRDRLCDQITKIVKSIDFLNKVLAITFEDHSEICAFARPEDYRTPCPEAFLFQSYKFKALYVENGAD